MLFAYSSPTYPSSDSLSALLGAYAIFVVLLVVISIVFNIVIYWRICSKAGYSGAMSLLMFVPFGALVMLCILAFGNWPIERELAQARSVAPQNSFNQYQGQPFPQQGYQQGQSYPQNPTYR